MLIPSNETGVESRPTSLSRRVNANSQHKASVHTASAKLIKKGEC